MNIKKLIRASIILIAFHIVLTMAFSCGIVNKQKSKNSMSRNTEMLSSESSSEISDERLSEWQKAWMQQFEYSTALIYSDSTITYLPDGGFHLTRGSLIFTQVNQKESTSEEGIVQRQSNITENNKLHQEKEVEQNDAVLSNKERWFPPPMIWIPLIALITTLLCMSVKRALK